MTIRPTFKWFDLWIGFFVDVEKRRLYFFPVPMFGIIFELAARYERIEIVLISYHDADRLIRGNPGKAEADQWRIAKEEDGNQQIGLVWIERRRRITSSAATGNPRSVDGSIAKPAWKGLRESPPALGACQPCRSDAASAPVQPAPLGSE